MSVIVRILVVAMVAAAVAEGAAASELIDRNASNVQLRVNSSGQALLSYTASGARRNVLVSGAVNAIHPTPGRAQVAFRLNYSGPSSLAGGCARYDGPALKLLVTACKAPDGSYWAVQSWQRMLPNYGLPASGLAAVWELRLSHWTGEIAKLSVQQNWAYRRYHHLFGTYTYLGRPVYGFRTTRWGVPLDTFGRNLYVDTLNSPYGQGWKRENSFVAHKGTGVFCYGFFPHGARPSGMGTRYRATVIGPGVTPDVYWEGPAPGAYDKAFDLAQHEAQKSLYAGGERLCKPV
jgi:hypothetical protein